MNWLRSISGKSYHKLFRIVWHLLFWVMSLGFFWMLFSRNTNDVVNTAIFLAILSPVAMAMTYFFNYKLIPRFLEKAHYFKFAWYASIVAIVGVWMIFMGGLFIWIWRAQFNLGEINTNTIDIPMLTAALFFVVMMGVSIKIVRSSIQEKYEREKSEKDRLMLDNQLKIRELKLLKDQLNPHFLFNTLNNIYGLTLEKSSNAPDLVMRLSNLLDYMLYRTDEPLVTLIQELDMIHDYIAIEKHRFEGKYPISYLVEGVADGKMIAPLLFLPLVENCFKHGIRKSIEESFVEIVVTIERTSVSIQTKNALKEEVEKSKGGLGVNNLRKRLDMIYPEKYELYTRLENDVYMALLTIYF